MVLCILSPFCLPFGKADDTLSFSDKRHSPRKALIFELQMVFCLQMGRLTRKGHDYETWNGFVFRTTQFFHFGQ
jgi:hypothetical protein